MHEITELLQAWNNDDPQALDKLMPLVDRELKKIARNYLRNERPEHILQTTALVHEALIKLIRENIKFENRQQFYAFVARRMRQILIDYARKGKRAEYIDVEDAIIPEEKSKEILMLEQALTKLARIDARKVSIIECRFFIGLTLKQTAELLGLSTATVERDWRFARSWLKREMTGES